MPGSEHWGFQVLMPAEPPYLVGEITVLATLDIYINVFSEPVSLYVWSGATYSGGATNEVSLNPSSGSWDLPCAVINGPAPVAEERQTWGQVKAIFR